MNHTRSNGLIAVDFDGTLAEYHGWNEGKLGPPIPVMLARVKHWLANGYTVCIFAARLSIAEQACEQTKAIQEWCREHIGQELNVTCTKDYRMVEFWDDRAVQVIPNTGIAIADKLAEMEEGVA